MQTYDGTGEFVRVDELRAGDHVRWTDGNFQRIVRVFPGDPYLLVYEAGARERLAPETRLLRRVDGAL